jgi:hypothetical protein
VWGVSFDKRPEVMAMQEWQLRVERRVIEEAENVTVKAIVIGFLLVVGITVAGCYSAFLRYDLIGTGHLPRCALFPVMLLALVNPIWRYFFGKPLFSRTELLFIYCTVLIMTGIPGQQFSNYLYLGLVSPVYFSSPRNMPALLQYEGLNWLQYIPDWALPSKDPRSGVIAWVFEGMPEGARIPWQPWVLPLALWTLFYLALFVSHILIAALLRKQWVEHEKLSFPLAQVPVEVADERRLTAMGRNLLFWFGFIIPVFVFTFRALHIYFPYFPNINIYPNWGAIFQGRPFDVLNYTPFNIYFDMIGVTYLIPSDVGFSFWFFAFVVRRLQMVVRSAMGLTDHQQPLEMQTIGGLFALFALQMWVARQYLRDVFVQAWRGICPDPNAAPLPYRHLLIMLGICVVFLVVWTVGFSTAIHWAIALFAIHYIWRIMTARMVAEAGLFVFWTPSPVNFLLRFFGRDLIGAPSISGLTMVHSKFSDSATCLMPQALQAFKIAHSEGLNQQQIFKLMLASTVVSMMVCHPTSLRILYTTTVPKMGWWTRGYPQWLANDFLTRLAQDLRMPTWHYFSLLGGAIVTVFLAWMRWQFFWWPFHPLGFAAANAVPWFGDRYGFSMLLGWLAKAMVMWFGGIRLWHFFRPFMMGMIIGNTFILFTLLLIHFFFPTNEVVVIE